MSGGVRRRKSGPHSAWRLEERERAACMCNKSELPNNIAHAPEWQKTTGMGWDLIREGERVAPPAHLLGRTGARVQLGAG